MGKFTTENVLLDGHHDKYDIWKLYSKIDILDWYKEVGQISFPSVSILARIYLAKPMSNALQERVFSTVGNVMTTKRTSLEACCVRLGTLF